ncbi:MAG: hypothetical protein Q9219_001540 [cf. Caloplaca sp. 3 TL-2023]
MRAHNPHDPTHQRKILHRLCIERSRGRPLQYIIGNQPFGELEILCRPRVLIPRPETETWTTHLANYFLPPPRQDPRNALRILDLCTGTGCISLHLLHSLLHHHRQKQPTPLSLQILGIDISPIAITLARRNLQHNVSRNLLPPTSATSQISFLEADIFVDEEEEEATWRYQNPRWDIIVANPPYISPRGFETATTRSVRNWEPRRALVPPPPPPVPSYFTINPATPTTAATAERNPDHEVGDSFYPRILAIAADVGAKVVAMEVGDMAQAGRVAGMVMKKGVWERCEIWRDGWGGRTEEGEDVWRVGGGDVKVRGKGEGRVVVGWK